jgi:tetratricopeptide (TPR) repeat protein
VLDDVHWADVPTLLLIEHVAAKLPSMRVLGVGTYRDVELDVSRPLVSTMERMVRARTVERIGLKRFDQNGVARMIEALAGREPPDAVVQVILEETEGNPFFVMEVFRHLAEEGRLFDGSGAFRTDLRVDELDVPESVRLVVGRRLERLGPEAQRALAAGAVVGRGFPFDLLEEIADLEPKALLDVVEQAEAARVVVPELRAGAIHYTFAHELIRQTLLTSLSLLRRQRLHLAVADAMERLAPDSWSPSEVAHHLLLAGAAAEAGRTLSYLESAAEAAMAAAAFEEALRCANDALSILDKDDPLRRARLMDLQGRAYRALGRWDECLEVWEEVVGAYVEAGEVEEAAYLLWHMGYLLAWLNRFADAFVLYERGTEVLGGRRVAATASLIASKALLLGFSGGAGMLEVSRELMDEAEAIGREVQDERQLGMVGWSRCVVEWSWANCGVAVEAGLRGVEHLRGVGDHGLLCDALAWLSIPLAISGRFEDGLAVAEEALELAMRLGHTAGEIIARRGVLANQTSLTGDLVALESGLRKDLALCLGIHSPWASQSHGWLAIGLAMRGEQDEALAHAEEALATEPASAWSGLAWVSLMYCRMVAGDDDQVRALLAEELPTLDGSAPAGAYLQVSIASEAAARLGLRDRCEQLYPAAVATTDRMVMRPFDWTLTERVAGMVAACAGMEDEAVRHFERALEQARSLPSVVDEPHVLHRYGELLLRRGDQRARGLLTEALACSRALGMELLAREVEVLLTSA